MRLGRKILKKNKSNEEKLSFIYIQTYTENMIIKT